MSTAHNQRAFDLLADRATGDLDSAGHRELEGLLAEHPDLDDGGFELAAAAIDLVWSAEDLAADPGQQLPASFRARLRDDAMSFFANSPRRGDPALSNDADVLPFPARQTPLSAAPRSTAAPGSRVSPGSAISPTSLIEPGSPADAGPESYGHIERASSRHPAQSSRRLASPNRATSWLGWAAAAAMLLVAIVGWWPRPTPPEPTVVVGPSTSSPPETPPGPADLREELLLASADTLDLPWTPTEDPAAEGAGGDVVWSTSAQEGYMRFHGLPANDPGVVQYQLWIFDTNQDERYPIDGGVFDVPAGAEEIIVPIDPKLRVNEPMLFAVTIEKPGGVVVSSRERLVLVAAVG